MRPERSSGCVSAAIVLALALSASPARGGERILFKDLPSADPVRQSVESVLGSRFYSLRDGFPAGDWEGQGYGAAWERARRYFPAAAYLVQPGTYFMAHGFDPGGRLFMEVHGSDYLRLCVANRLTFADGPAGDRERRMLAAADGPEGEAFQEKLGLLAPYFRDGTGQAGLRRALGPELHGRLLERLREEDYHMLGGGLMHEGLHAGLDDALVARVQAEFGAGTRPVQWDELRAFMAEIGYHGAFIRLAGTDIAAGWGRIGSLLGDLERLRGPSVLRTGSGRERLERTAVRISAHAALVRARAREIWQSARRRRDLAVGFRRDYVKNGVPAGIDALLSGAESEADGVIAAAGSAIEATELALRDLEEFLGTWQAWAAGARPFPAPVTDSRAVVGRAAGARWPEPAGREAAALMKKAAEALEKERRPG